MRAAFTGPVPATACHEAAHSAACILLRALLECAEIGPGEAGGESRLVGDGNAWRATEVGITRAVAHEIGHLFNLPHSPQGIMHGDWDKRDLSNMAMGRLNFSPEQAGQIRAEVTRRTHEAQTVEMASLR